MRPMRLGIAQWAYQWFLAGPNSRLFVDRDSLAYAGRGMGLPYFLTTPRHVRDAVPSNPTEWVITRCGQLGVDVAHCSIDLWDDRAHLERVKSLLERYHLELVPGNTADMVCMGDQAKRGQDECIAALERYAKFGGVRLSKFNTTMTFNRFSRQVPVDEQLGMIKENCRPIVKAAAELDIILALENHYDYRAAEIRQIIEQVDSPYLRSLLDVGNAFAVCEDPVDAARALAPYVVLVHLKDCLILPWTPASSGFYACQYAVPLGEGNVDLQQIASILQERAPDPSGLCLAIETVPVPPLEDEDLWVVEAIRWARRNLAHHLT